MTLRARIRVVALVVAAFFVGLLARVPQDEHAPRKEKRDLRATAAVHEIARLEKQRAALRGDVDTLAGRLEASEKERARLERKLAAAAERASPPVVTWLAADLARLDGPLVYESKTYRLRHATVEAALSTRARNVEGTIRWLDPSKATVELRHVDLSVSKDRIPFDPRTPEEER